MFMSDGNLQTETMQCKDNEIDDGIEQPVTNSQIESRHDEYGYLEAISTIMRRGKLKPNRTGIDTLSIFGMQLRFDLRSSFPLLTTKRVFWRGIVEELLWFINGHTDGQKLLDKNVHIWEANGSVDFLKTRGITGRRANDLGPIYGFQWRHFGAEYENCDDDYSGKGVDQLKEAIEKIKSHPEDRRIIVTAWNPVDLPKMALPPCHCLMQFYVADGELSCQMYQRAADFGLGVPFNIASYSLLTIMVAHVTNLKPGDFVHTFGDAHVYVNHIEPLKEQLKREPRPFPRVKITRQIKDIDDFTYEDFELDGYNPHPKISMDMAL